MKKKLLIYILHSSSGVMLVTTQVKRLSEFLGNCVTPYRHGLIIYEDGDPYSRRVVPVDDYMPTVAKPRRKKVWKNIVDLLVENLDCKNERSAKLRIKKGEVSINGKVVESPDHKVDMSEVFSLRVGKWKKSILGGKGKVVSQPKPSKKMKVKKNGRCN